MIKQLMVGLVAFGVIALVPFSHAQDDDFTDELEAELEAEIGLENSNDSGSDEGFQEVDSEEEEGKSAKKDAADELDPELSDDTEGDEEFADEDFSEEEFADEDFSDEDFADEDFSDEEFAEESLEDETLEGAAESDPEEQKVGDSIGEESFEDPLEENIEEDSLEGSTEDPLMAEDPLDEAPEETPTSFQSTDALSPMAPNLEYEAKLYDIYVNYHSSPTSNTEWQTLLGSRRAEVYTIAKGDTLWGISETFFGDGNYWPKVWSINTKIENPHLIQPSNQIQFVMGTEDEAPMFTVTQPESEESVAPEQELSEKDVEKLVDAGALSAQDTEKLQEIIETDMQEAEMPTDEPPLQSTMESGEGEEDPMDPDIEIPPPSIISRPVLRKLPPSVPEWQGRTDDDRYDDLGIDYGVRPISRLKDSKYLLSFVDDADVDSDARVMETEKGGYYGSDADFIYVKFPKGRGQTGEEYIVVKSHGRIRPPTKSIETTDLGYQKQIAGLVRLGKRVKADVGDEYQAFRAQVIKSVNPMQLGSRLIKGTLPEVDLSSTGPRSTVVAQIVGGTGGKTRAVFGKGSIVYINRGQKEGIRVGQVLQVRAHKENRFAKTKVLEHNRVIGEIKIVKTVERFATAVVLSSDDMIIAGDLTGKGELQYRPRGEVITASATAYTEGNYSTNGIGEDAPVGDESTDEELESMLNEEGDFDADDEDGFGDDSEF